MRFGLAFSLSVLLLGVATLRAQSNPAPAAPASGTYLVMGNDDFSFGGWITIYYLVDGIPQNPSSAYWYRVGEVPEVLSVDPTAQRLYVAAATDNNQGEQ